MMRTDTVRAKVRHITKVRAQRVLDRLGLSMSDAINLMLVQVEMQKGLPFELVLPKEPNEETKRVLESTDKGKDLVECKDAEELFNKLGIE